MTTHTDSFRNYIKDPANFNQGQGNNYDLIFPIWFTETQFDQTVSVKASPAAQYENDSYHRGKNTIYFELDYPGTEIASCRMVVNCDNAVRVLQQSDGETTGYSQGNGRLLLSNAGMANTETNHFTLKNGKNRFIFEVANHGDPQGGPSYLLACAVTSDPTNNLIFHTGYNFCRWGGYTAATNPTYDSLGQGWKWKNGFFTNTDAPVLSGVPGNVTIKDNESYTIPTVTATDTTDGSLTVTISNGGFNSNGSSSHTTGSYTITFTATDSNSITTTSSYILTVQQSASPPTLFGVPGNTTIDMMDYYNIPTGTTSGQNKNTLLPKVTAQDQHGNSLSVSVTSPRTTWPYSNFVNSSTHANWVQGSSSHTLGIHTVTYTATDPNTSLSTSRSYTLEITLLHTGGCLQM